MVHPEDQLQAARDLMADGVSVADAVAALVDQFGISEPTAYRRVRAVRGDAGLDPPAGDDVAVDYAALALAALADSVDAARSQNDWEAVASRAERLGNMAAKLRLRWVPRP